MYIIYRNKGKITKNPPKTITQAIATLKKLPRFFDIPKVSPNRYTKIYETKGDMIIKGIKFFSVIITPSPFCLYAKLAYNFDRTA
jgi:hypothetical protein